jgi:OmcA/MtrC family decaheme c-type cytochrome
VTEGTVATKREGLDYALAPNGATSIDLVAGRFAAGGRVVASYRTDGRFGWYPGPGEPLQALYPPAAADTDDIDMTWGDWKALAIQDGTYAVGMWANRDFTVTSAGLLTTTGAWNDLNTDNTTYRMITPPATHEFLYGAATSIESRTVIASGASCNACHGDIQAHGNGRRGLATCLACHSTSGLEDAAPYSFDGWYVPKTPGVTMDFRTLLHKVHMGKELASASSYVVDGVFLGTAYPVSYGEIGFPSMPGEASNCAACHGDGNAAWHAPAPRVSNGSATPVRDWRAACGSCHDSSPATAHIDVQTALSGVESCDVCHGEDKTWSVELAHKVR